MDEIRIFENPEFGTIRSVDIDGEPYFVGKDMALSLGYTNTRKALQDNVDEEDKVVTKVTTQGGLQNTIVINESGVYSLVFGSKLKSAKKFKHWVTSEVLPSIRKHGAYMTEQTIEQALTSPDFLIELATKLKEEQEKRKQLEIKVEQDKPLVDFATQVSKSSDLIDIAQMAKLARDEHIDIGRNKLFAWLKDKRILLSDNTPYQRYIDQNYFVVKEVIKNIVYGTKVFPKTYVTGKGQKIKARNPIPFRGWEELR